MTTGRQGLLPIYEETGWRAPESLPVLGDQYKRIGIDFEGTGTDVRGRDEAVGMSLYLPDGRSFYLPWGHRGGGNLDKNLIVKWANRELRGKELVFAEAKIDVRYARKAGIDFEELGCKLRETQFAAALLDEYRRSFRLDDMAQDYLGEGKLQVPTAHLWELPASVAGPYAQQDARLTYLIDEHLSPQISEQGLDRVLDLENDLLYCTIHMEDNGAPLNMDLLRRWIVEVKAEYQRIILDLYETYGLRVNPNAAKDLERLFKKLDLPYEQTAKSGQGSFTDEFLRSVDHPAVAAVRRARSLTSLLSKYLEKYLKAVDDDGILYYKLHQLKGDDYGTVSGRYSSSSVNIQQVFDPERQEKKLGTADYIIRKLFYERDGFWMKVDASQIEFRLFAHYSKSRKLIQSYIDNPLIDYHQIVAEMLGLPRKQAKSMNFGKLYAMGRDKMAHDMGLSRLESDPLFDQYDAMFPEAKTLLNLSMKLAEERGYVKTLLGRRARFPTKNRLHSALNRVIQGSAADVMKLKLLETYRHRKELGLTMRFTVHDELNGRMYEESKARQLKELLEAPILGIRVPLVWDLQVGPNWADGQKLAA